jgi:hypothetical protein
MIRHLRRAAYRRIAWDNGGGTTEEIARADDTRGLLWRLSLATVAAEGPFSLMPGVDRVLTVTAGPGFSLVPADAGHGGGLSTGGPPTPSLPHGGGREAPLLTVLPMRTVAFAGERALRAVGVRGPCLAFNVLTGRGRVRAGVDCVRGTFALSAAVAAVHAAEPGGVEAFGRRWTLAAGDTLIAEGELEGRAVGAVVTVTLGP